MEPKWEGFSSSSAFGELLSDPATIAAHGSYTLTVSRWITCKSYELAANDLAASCVPPCSYHYNPSVVFSEIASAQ
jgi:hypothetical protein